MLRAIGGDRGADHGCRDAMDLAGIRCTVRLCDRRAVKYHTGTYKKLQDMSIRGHLALKKKKRIIEPVQ